MPIVFIVRVLRGDELRPSYPVQPGAANGMNNNALRTHIVDEFLPEFDLMDLNIPSKVIARRMKHRLDMKAEIDFIITLTSPSVTIDYTANVTHVTKTFESSLPVCTCLCFRQMKLQTVHFHFPFWSPYKVILSPSQLHNIHI